MIIYETFIIQLLYNYNRFRLREVTRPTRLRGRERRATRRFRARARSSSWPTCAARARPSSTSAAGTCTTPSTCQARPARAGRPAGRGGRFRAGDEDGGRCRDGRARHCPDLARGARPRPRLQRVTAAAGATAGADAGAGRAGPVGYSKQIIPVGLSKWILPDSVPALPVSRTLPRSCVRPRSRTARAGRRQGLVSWPLS